MSSSARWAWRQLTSMRTALVLLFLLALAALPGSLVPQRSVDPLRAAQFAAAAPDARAVVRAALAVRGLLLAVVRGDLPAAVRLAGRLRPAAQQAAPHGRTRPPAAAPAQPVRLPVHVSWSTDRSRRRRCSPQARRQLRVRPVPRRRRSTARWRRSEGTRARPATWSSTSRCCCCWSPSRWAACSASRPPCCSSRGRRSPTPSRPTTRSPEARRSTSGSLAPFTVGLDDLSVRYQTSGDQRGAPRDFRAAVTLHVLARVAGASRRPAGQPPAQGRRRPRSSCSATATRRCSPCATRPARSCSADAGAVPAARRQHRLDRCGEGASARSRSSSASRACSCPPRCSTRRPARSRSTPT